MSKPLVVDASAALTYLLGEADHGGVAAELALRDQLLVPWLFWSEVINALARRHGWPASQVLSAVYDLEQLGLHGEAASRPMMLAVIDAVEAHGLTAYDAEYLVLAQAADADLLTGDGYLAAAYGDRAILIGAGHRLGEADTPYGLRPIPPRPDWPTWPGAAAYVEELRREVNAGNRSSRPDDASGVLASNEA